ncbi:hypothetical protein AKJ16_DCAP13130 [Drosera capensis]
MFGPPINQNFLTPLARNLRLIFRKIAFNRNRHSRAAGDINQSIRPSMATANRWLRPENLWIDLKVYPLFAAVGVAVGICGMQLVRNIVINPEVRVIKEKRAAGVLENHSEGEKYADHFVRRYLRNKSPEIMPSINHFFADPNRG